MSSYRWLSLCAFCGIAIAMLSLGVRAEEEVSTDPAGGQEKAADEKSILITQQPAKPEVGEHDFCHCVGEGKSPGEARIEEALRGPLRSTGLDYTDAPLEEVISNMSQEFDIPILLDENALEAIGLGTDEPVTIQLNNISLRSALRLMLHRLKLTYIVQDEVLLITSQDEADRHLVMCVYDVEGLVDEANGESMDSLIDAIVTCVATETWAENGGGEAEVRPLKPGLLVVSQTQPIQEEISGLLSSIRKMRELVPFTHSHVREPEPAEQK